MKVRSIGAEKVLSRIGNTPLVRLKDISPQNSSIYAKLEWFNPFGSVKDRAAYWMLRTALKSGGLQGRTIIEPTSGNTGIALAGIAREMGVHVRIITPKAVSTETKRLLKLLGAEILETEDDLCPRVGRGTDQSIALAQAIVKSEPDSYFMPNQYQNEANFLAHYETTGPEIWRDTGGRITHFVAGIGTGGTITGVAQYLKERNPQIKIYAVEPQKGHHIQGLRNLEESSMPEVLKRRSHLIDEWIRVSDEEAFTMVRSLALQEKLLVGPSSGAVAHVCLQIDGRESRNVIVGIFADTGIKFESLYREFSVLDSKDFSHLRRSGYLLGESLEMLLS